MVSKDKELQYQWKKVIVEIAKRVASADSQFCRCD